MAEGTRFKTGFVGAPVSFGEMGRQVAGDIAQSAQAIQQERMLKQNTLNTSMGFTKALEQAVPEGVMEKYREGAQILLDKYQEAAAKAYSSGIPSDVARYQKLRNEFMQLKNISTAKSALDQNTRLSVANGTIKNVAGETQDVLAEFDAYNQAEYMWDEATDSLKVRVGNGFVNWTESNIADMNDVFVPAMKWGGSEYMPDKYGERMYNDVLKQEELIFQRRDDEGYAVGMLNEGKVYDRIGEVIQQDVLLRSPDLIEAIQANGYRRVNVPGKTELTEQDFVNAQRLYPPELMFAKVQFQNRNVGVDEGKFTSEGEWKFTVSDDELSQMENGPELVNARKAIKTTYEDIGRDARNRVGVDIQFDRSTSGGGGGGSFDPLMPALTQFSAKIPSPATPDVGLTITLFEKGALTGVAKGDEERIEQKNVSLAGSDVSKVKLYVGSDKTPFNITDESVQRRPGQTGEPNSRAIVVNNAVLDNETGELIGFDIASSPDMIDGKLADLRTMSNVENITILANDPRFEEVLAGYKDAHPGSKSKRKYRDTFFQDLQEGQVTGIFVKTPEDIANEEYLRRLLAEEAAQ